MSVFAPAAAALLTLLARVDIDGIVVDETRAGEAPLIANQQPRATFANVVVLHLLDPGLELRLDYAPRLFWLAATDTPTTTPLWLNVVDLTASLQTSPRLKITGKANFTQGKTDYQFLSQTIYGAGQAAVPTSIEVLSVTAGEITEVRADPTWTVIVEADAAYRKPESTTTVVVNGQTMTIPYPRQKGVQVVPSAIDRLSNANDLVLSSGVSLQSTSNIFGTMVSSPTMVSPLGGETLTDVGNFEVLTITPEIGWRTRPSPWRQLHLGAGVAYNHVFETPYSVPTRPFSPIANVDWSVNVMTGHEAAYRGTVSAAVDYFVNPVIATAGPRALVAGAIYYAVPDWMVGLEGAFATPIGTRSLAEWRELNMTIPGMAPPVPPDETVASLSLPVRHRVSRNFIAEVGGRWADRGPRLTGLGDGLGFHQRQLWVYLSLTATSVPVKSSLTP